MTAIPMPLLAMPTLSRSADVLTAEDREAQLTLGLDVYDHLRNGVLPPHSKWRPARMWRGHTGALLFWCGELARGLPGGPLDAPRHVQAWVDAYRASEMAVGPLPWWLGHPRFHLHCQSQLIHSDVQYAHVFPHAPLEMAYLLPLEENEWQTV